MAEANLEDVKREMLVEVNRRMDDGADFLLSDSKRNLIKSKAIDSWILLRSGFVNRQFLEKEIGFSAPHAGVIEFGSRPHMPPVEPFIGWARRVLRLSTGIARKAAWAVAINIKKFGTIPRPYFRPAINALVRRGI